MIDTGILAGDLFNELNRRSAYVPRVIYLVGGDWRLRVQRKKGVIPGFIELSFSMATSTLEIRFKWLWKSRVLERIDLSSFSSQREAIGSICDRVMPRLSQLD